MAAAFLLGDEFSTLEGVGTFNGDFLASDFAGLFSAFSGLAGLFVVSGFGGLFVVSGFDGLFVVSGFDGLFSGFEGLDFCSGLDGELFVSHSSALLADFWAFLELLLAAGGGELGGSAAEDLEALRFLVLGVEAGFVSALASTFVVCCLDFVGVLLTAGSSLGFEVDLEPPANKATTSETAEEAERLGRPADIFLNFPRNLKCQTFDVLVTRRICKRFAKSTRIGALPKTWASLAASLWMKFLSWMGGRGFYSNRTSYPLSMLTSSQLAECLR